jgi:hypothetical protein
MTFLDLCRAAGAAAILALGSVAFAAAPGDIDIDADIPSQTALDYALETEMVVHDWVLCVSQPLAEQLARARAVSLADARSAYAELANARSCGQFPELRVILRERVYASAPDSGHDARVFGALVNLSGDWASAFVVFGGLTEE